MPPPIDPYERYQAEREAVRRQCSAEAFQLGSLVHLWDCLDRDMAALNLASGSPGLDLDRFYYSAMAAIERRQAAGRLEETAALAEQERLSRAVEAERGRIAEAAQDEIRLAASLPSVEARARREAETRPARLAALEALTAALGIPLLALPPAMSDEAAAASGAPLVCSRWNGIVHCY